MYSKAYLAVCAPVFITVAFKTITVDDVAKKLNINKSSSKKLSIADLAFAVKAPPVIQYSNSMQSFIFQPYKGTVYVDITVGVVPDVTNVDALSTYCCEPDSKVHFPANDDAVGIAAVDNTLTKAIYKELANGVPNEKLDPLESEAYPT